LGDLVEEKCFRSLCSQLAGFQLLGAPRLRRQAGRIDAIGMSLNRDVAEPAATRIAFGSHCCLDHVVDELLGLL
jgi:hypothetical protein